MECRLNPSVIFSSFLYFLGSRPPLQVLSKGGVNVSLLFTEVIFKHLVDYYLFFLFFFSPLSSSLLLSLQNASGPDIVVMVLSTISTNPFPISNYLIQAAAPKACQLNLLIFIALLLSLFLGHES